ITNTATVSTTSIDANSSNNSASVQTSIGCTTVAPQLSTLGTSAPTSGILTWIGNGAANYVVYLDVAGKGCTSTTPYGSTSTTNFPYASLTPNTTYEWRVDASSPNCLTVSSSCGTFTTGSNCAVPAATLIAPAGNATVASPVHLQWSAVTGATSYDIFVSSNGGPSTKVATTSSTTADVN